MSVCENMTTNFVQETMTAKYNLDCTNGVLKFMSKVYIHELAGCSLESDMFDKPLDFTEQRNHMSRQLQTVHMIITHGKCPKLGVLSTPGVLGREDWILEKNRLYRILHKNTPSLKTLFHQYVDKRMADTKQKHLRTIEYLAYRQNIQNQKDISVMISPVSVVRKSVSADNLLYEHVNDMPIPAKYWKLTEQEARRRMLQSAKARA
jgi:hemoglobin-like flavoprotein